MGYHEKWKWLMYYFHTPKGRHDAEGFFRFLLLFALGVFCLEMGLSLWGIE